MDDCAGQPFGAPPWVARRCSPAAAPYTAAAARRAHASTTLSSPRIEASGTTSRLARAEHLLTVAEALAARRAASGFRRSLVPQVHMSDINLPCVRCHRASPSSPPPSLCPTCRCPDIGAGGQTGACQRRPAVSLALPLRQLLASAVFYAHLPSTTRALASGIAIITAALAVAYLLLVSAFQLSLLASGSC
jgi:hypothetical protein